MNYLEKLLIFGQNPYYQGVLLPHDECQTELEPRNTLECKDIMFVPTKRPAGMCTSCLERSKKDGTLQRKRSLVKMLIHIGSKF